MRLGTWLARLDMRDRCSNSFARSMKSAAWFSLTSSLVSRVVILAFAVSRPSVTRERAPRKGPDHPLDDLPDFLLRSSRNAGHQDTDGATTFCHTYLPCAALHSPQRTSCSERSALTMRTTYFSSTSASAHGGFVGRSPLRAAVHCARSWHVSDLLGRILVCLIVVLMK